jgi:hypothetical protein
MTTNEKLVVQKNQDELHKITKRILIQFRELNFKTHGKKADIKEQKKIIENELKGSK